MELLEDKPNEPLVEHGPLLGVEPMQRVFEELKPAFP